MFARATQVIGALSLRGDSRCAVAAPRAQELSDDRDLAAIEGRMDGHAWSEQGFVHPSLKGETVSQVLLEGYTVDEILELPNDELRAIVLRDEPLVFRAASANILGSFGVRSDTLVLELAHIDGGGEGALPAIASLARRYSQREGLGFVEWRVHAVHCARPNLKLRRVLERRGFTVRDIEGVGECYWLRTAVAASRTAATAFGT